jgi:hypothetical protein
MVAQVLKYRRVLEAAIARVPALQAADVDRAVLLLMAYDHLLGRGIDGGGAVKRIIKENDALLRAAFAEQGSHATAEETAGDGAGIIARPRFVRVNTLKMIVSEAVSALTSSAVAGSGKLLAISEVAIDPLIP